MPKKRYTPEEIIHGVAVLEAIARSAALHQPVESKGRRVISS